MSTFDQEFSQFMGGGSSSGVGFRDSFNKFMVSNPKPVIKANNSSKIIKPQPKPNFFQQAEQGIGNFFSGIKKEFTPNPLSKPIKPVGNINPTPLPSGLKLDFVNPSQNADAHLKVTPKSLKQEAQSIKQTKPILDAIQKQIDITKNQIQSGMSGLLNTGIVANENQLMPRKEYKTQAEYNQAVKKAKETQGYYGISGALGIKGKTFSEKLNNFLGFTLATAPLMQLGGQFIDPIVAKIAMRIPGGTNILANILSLGAKSAIKAAPYGTTLGTLQALYTAKNNQQKVMDIVGNTALFAVVGFALAGADGIASELVNKFGQKAETFLANKDLIYRVVTGRGTPEDIRKFNIINDQGLSAEAARSKEGINVTNKTQKQGLVWDILRTIFDNHYQPKTAGETTKTPTETTQNTPTSNAKNLLQAGEYTPQEVRKIVLNSELKNTPEGKTIINHSIQAENQGKNVKITKQEVKQLPETTQQTTPTKPVYNSAQSRAIQAQFTDSLSHIQQTATSQEELVKGVDEAVSKAETLANGDKTVLAGVRTALNKMMFDFAGHSGDYKKDYAILQSLKDDPMIGDFIKTLEGHVNRISENMLKPSPEIIQKPVSGKNLLSPVGTGEVKTSKLAERVTKAMGFYKDIPEYNTASNKDQAQMAADLVAKDPKQAFNIAMGTENAPKGMLPAFTYEAVRANAEATGDITTLRALATQSKLSLQGTAAGQFIQSLSQVDPTSSVAYMKQAIEAKKQLAKEQLKGKSVDKIQKDQVNKLKSDISKAAPTKNDWQSFIDSIQC